MPYEVLTLFDADGPDAQIMAPPDIRETLWRRYPGATAGERCDHCDMVHRHALPNAAPIRQPAWLRISTDHGARLLLCDAHAQLIAYRGLR